MLRTLFLGAAVLFGAALQANGVFTLVNRLAHRGAQMDATIGMPNTPAVFVSATVLLSRT